MANPMMLTDMVKLYVKPSLGGQIIMRKPTTHQTSERVKSRQFGFATTMKGNRVAASCKGRKGRAFYGCLRSEGYAHWHGTTSRR